ncbi:MAG: twin transmembrane helix small protein [Methylohalobius sp. ZOD2]|nr:twin transmembrane helix small protein [Methylothermaceae bacterium]
MWIKLLVILAFLGIVLSLGSALYHLLKHKNLSQGTVKALTIRIILSLVLFLFLLFAASQGWIKPHGVQGGLLNSQKKGATE